MVAAAGLERAGNEEGRNGAAAAHLGEQGRNGTAAPRLFSLSRSCKGFFCCLSSTPWLASAPSSTSCPSRRERLQDEDQDGWAGAPAPPRRPRPPPGSSR